MKPWDDERRLWRELVQLAQRRLWSYGDFLAPHVDLDDVMHEGSDQESDVAGGSGNSGLESSKTAKTK